MAHFLWPTVYIYSAWGFLGFCLQGRSVWLIGMIYGMSSACAHGRCYQFRHVRSGPQTVKIATFCDIFTHTDIFDWSKQNFQLALMLIATQTLSLKTSVNRFTGDLAGPEASVLPLHSIGWATARVYSSIPTSGGKWSNPGGVNSRGSGDGSPPGSRGKAQVGGLGDEVLQKLKPFCKLLHKFWCSREQKYTKYYHSDVSC